MNGWTSWRLFLSLEWIVRAGNSPAGGQLAGDAASETSPSIPSRRFLVKVLVLWRLSAQPARFAATIPEKIVGTQRSFKAESAVGNAESAIGGFHIDGVKWSPCGAELAASRMDPFNHSPWRTRNASRGN
jgi:hypothetical protein